MFAVVVRLRLRLVSLVVRVLLLVCSVCCSLLISYSMAFGVCVLLVACGLLLLCGVVSWCRMLRVVADACCLLCVRNCC